MSGKEPGFEVDAERLGAQAGEFEALAERAARIVADLRAAVEGSPWGADAVGQSFRDAHEAPVAAVLGRFGDLPSGLGDLGARFADAAVAYRAADSAAADDVTGAGSAG
ncbi:hypothetical protein ABZ863_14670 [Saccharomonospora sp. NPDC046836]|uniref:hypothetical protein n=1 Tax=Saccharomonospora sp. NPDC046836 TaxID=3156921 RepID=UPI00340C3CDB